MEEVGGGWEANDSIGKEETVWMFDHRCKINPFMLGGPILVMKNQPHCKTIIWEGLILNKLSKHSLSEREKSVSLK